MEREQKIKKRKVPWRHREHLFTPSNITKLEFCCSCDRRCPQKLNVKFKVRCQRNGKVIWIMKGGEIVENRKH